MKELNEGIVTALRALPSNATTLQAFNGEFAVFAQQPVPADVADFSPATAAAPSLYIVVGPTVGDSNPPDKSGDQREIVTQITVWGKKAYNSAGALDRKANEIREELHRRIDKIATTGTVSMFEVEGVTSNDVDFWYGRVLGVRVLFDWFAAQTESLAFDGAADLLRHDNVGVGGEASVGEHFSVSIWHKPDAAFGSRDGQLFECWDVADPTKSLISVRARHDLAPDRVTIKLADSGALVTEYEYNDLLTLDAWNLTSFDFSKTNAPAGVIQLYQDGVFVAETTIVSSAFDAFANPLRIFEVGRNYLGTIGQVTLYGQRLTAAQQAQVFAEKFAFDARKVTHTAGIQGHIMKHWWRLGHDAFGIGEDSLFQRGRGETSSPSLPGPTVNLLTEAAGIDATNIVTDAPA